MRAQTCADKLLKLESTIVNVHTTDLNRTAHAHAGACCWISSCSDCGGHCGISSIDISRKIRYGVNRETKGLLTRAAVKKPRRRPRAPEARVVPLVPAGPRGSSRKPTVSPLADRVTYWSHAVAEIAHYSAYFVSHSST